LLATVSLNGCLQRFEPKDQKIKPDTLASGSLLAETAAADSFHFVIPVSEQVVMGTLFQQHTAEYRALCQQAFNQARYRLEPDLRGKTVNLPQAIIVDIDATLPGNSIRSDKDG